MFGYQFQPSTIRKYVVLFGTLFNDTWIQRVKSDGNYQLFRVPLSYGPSEKFIARLKEDPDLTRPNAISLPRMGFEITNAYYDGSRKLSTIHRNIRSSTSAGSVTSQYVPVPWNFEFTLTVLSKTAEDATRIVEQILPFFTPQWNVRAKINDAMPNFVYDIPIVLSSVTSQDTYDDAFTERRAVFWTLVFTLKGYVFGPATTPKIIKIADANFYVPGHANTSLDDTAVAELLAMPLAENVNVRPGLTANGEPTSNSAISVDVTEIDINDDYGYITTTTSIDES